jgi:hypothetical protein
MRLRRPAACCLLLAGCATAHPDFERRFDTAASTGPTQDVWMVALDMRYGCDTVLVKAHGQAPRTLVWMHARESQPDVRVGMSPCDLGSLIRPEVVRAWHTPPGVREQWLYRTHGGSPLSSVFLEGSSQRELRVTATAR